VNFQGEEGWAGMIRDLVVDTPRELLRCLAGMEHTGRENFGFLAYEADCLAAELQLVGGDVD